MAITTFTASQVLTAAQMNAVQSNDFNQTVSTKTASYTLVASDKGTRVEMNAAGATTITVNTSLFTAGDTLVLQNIGAGVCTVTAGTATVSSAGPLAIPQNGSGTLFFTSAGVSIFYPSAVTVAAPPASGLTRIGGGTLSGASTVFSNVFSASFKTYVVQINDILTVADSAFHLKFGATTSGYAYSVQFFQPTTAMNLDVGSASDSKIILGTTASSSGQEFSNYQVTIFNPFDTARTQINSFGQYNLNVSQLSFGNVNATTSFTDFTLLSGTSTFTRGTVNIFGYAAS